MPLSHFLNGIYSIEENPMDATNGTFQKAETKRKKQVKMYKRKNYKHRKERTSKNQLKYLRRLHLKNIYFPSELDQQIIVDEDATSAGVCSDE